MYFNLFKHNLNAYKKVKEMLEKFHRACIIHATGTGKSFIALELMYDYLQKNPNAKILYFAPLNGIFDQLQEHIKASDKSSDVFKNVEFINYAGLVNKTREELKSMKADLIICDEFHHIGAPEWTKRLEILLDNNKEASVFGMSATAIRCVGTKHEEDVSETFFEGHVASRYDLSQAIVDGVLPQPDYHMVITVLKGEVKELERKINDKNATVKEKLRYKHLLADVKNQLESGDFGYDENQILKKLMKSNGKYIYFCQKGTNIQELQERVIAELPEEYRKNIEIYHVHSNEQSQKANREEADNFYHNKTLNGEDASKKLRIMFAIDMYNEGIHVPDIDGVIMGRSTKSDIVFYQQLGRALAVKKTDTINKIESPLVIDLMGNIVEIKDLYANMKNIIGQSKNTNLSQGQNNNKDDNDNDYEKIKINFSILDKIINLTNELEEIRKFTDFKLSFEEKLEELARYAQENNEIPTANNKDAKFSDNIIMGFWLFNNKQDIEKLAEEKNNEYAKIIMETYKANQGLSFEEKLEEFAKYVKVNKKIPTQNNKDIKFSDNTMMGIWFFGNKQKIEEIAEEKNNEYAKIIMETYKANQGLSIEEKLEELARYVQKNKEIPTKSNKDAKFSDNTMMGNWFYFNKQEIEKLAEENNDNAKMIMETYKANQGLSFEKKLEELARYVQKNKKIPTKSNKDAKFSDNVLMANWFFNNKQDIEKLAEDNDNAKIIMETFKANQGLSFEEKLEELARYVQENQKLPTVNNKDAKFSDNVLMANWFFNNKQKIQERAKESNEYAKIIMDTIKANQGLSFEEKLEELARYAKENKELPIRNNKDAKFSDNVVMGTWIFYNKQKIEKLAKENNKYAKIIMDTIKANQGLSIEEKLEELARYVQKNKKIPTKSNKDAKFSDNVLMANWFFYNKQDIEKLAEENNEYAKMIMETYKANQGLSFEKKLEELARYVQENQELPTANNKDAKFSDNVVMGTWFFGNKQKIQERAKANNEYAKMIMETFKANQGLSFDGKLKEFAKYVKVNKKIPAQNNKDVKFSDNVMMGNWFYDNKQKIEKLAKANNEYAKIIMDTIKANQGLSFKEKLEELARYAQENKELPTVNNKVVKFSDNIIMGYWFFDHKQKIEKLAKENNEYAKMIMDTFKANQGLSFEEKLKEFAKYLKVNKKIPTDNNKDAKFSDNVRMSSWFSNNKQKIKKLAEEKNNEYAKLIMEEYEKNKKLRLSKKFDNNYNRS